MQRKKLNNSVMMEQESEDDGSEVRDNVDCLHCASWLLHCSQFRHLGNTVVNF